MDILIVDVFGHADYPLRSEGENHGYTVLMSALEIAPRADFSALEGALGDFDYAEGGVRGAGTESTEFGVINLSIGGLPQLDSSGNPRRPTDEEVNPLADPPDEEVNVLAGPRFQDLIGTGGLTNSTDAVITKAAGNEKMGADFIADNILLARDSGTGSRVLIIGALDNYARPGNNAEIASSYSNRAGNDPRIQERFLVEYGGSPFSEGVFLCDTDTAPDVSCGNIELIALDQDENEGTSFAAPRVAGFAALVRQKFPNLSGEQTATILLDTATYEGLACYPNCRVNIYGQGRVDIGEALSPMGSVQ